MNNPRPNTNVTIDLFKFIFAIVLMIHHAGIFYFVNGVNICANGFLMVEFFFMVSGYFLYDSAFSKADSQIARTSCLYIFKKYIDIFPYFFSAIMLSLTVYSILEHYTIVKVFRSMLDAIPELLMLQMFGFSGFWATGVSWYLSALFFALAILYPLCLKFKSNISLIVSPVLIFLIYGFIAKETGSLSMPDYWFGLIFKGMLRGVAGIAIGTIIYEACQFLKKIEFNTAGQILLSFIEWNLYFLAIFLTFWRKQSNNDDFYMVLLLFVAVTISFSNQSFLTNLLNRTNPKSRFFRKASLCIYFNNLFWAVNINHVFPNQSDNYKLIGYILLCFGSAILNYLLAQGLIRFQLRKRFLRIFTTNYHINQC